MPRRESRSGGIGRERCGYHLRREYTICVVSYVVSYVEYIIFSNTRIQVSHFIVEDLLKHTTIITHTYVITQLTYGS